MSEVLLDPYLYFRGNCREAMEFYKGVFGGELVLQTYADVPGDRMGMADDKIVHARLAGGLVKIFGSDSAQASESAAKIELALGGDDDTALRRVFSALAEGGTIKMPLEKQFWGDEFGALRDRYGVDWMVNIATAGNSVPN